MRVMGISAAAMLAMAGFAMTGAALAQDAADADSGIYARIQGGVSLVSDIEQDFTYNPSTVFAVGPPTAQSINMESGYTVGGAIGFAYPDATRTELEYRYVSSPIDLITQTGGFGGPVAFEPGMSLDAHFLMANGYFDFANDSAITPFIGAGFGGALITNERGERDGDFAYQGRAGVSINLGGGVEFSAEYVYLRTGGLEFGPREFTPTGPIGPLTNGGIYQSSSVMMSIRKLF